MVFGWIKDGNLKTKSVKGVFNATRVEILQYISYNPGAELDSDKIKCITEAHLPQFKRSSAPR